MPTKPRTRTAQIKHMLSNRELPTRGVVVDEHDSDKPLFERTVPNLHTIE